MADTASFPYGSIVRITDTINGRNFQGSGVLIAPDEVLTAAHMVWRTGIGVATDIEVTPGYSQGLAPFGRIQGAVTHYNPINVTDGAIPISDIAYDFAIIRLSRATAAGSMRLLAGFTRGDAIVSGYPATKLGVQVNSEQYVDSTDAYDLLYGSALGPGSSGGPVWTVDASGPAVVGLVSAADDAGNGYFVKITAEVRNTILSWVEQDHAAPALAAFTNTSNGVSGPLALTAAWGGPSYLQWQYIWSGNDGVALSTETSNVFLCGGPGQDAIQAGGGRNVLDGGAGSNFLTGGTGDTTFFTDARGGAPVWNTIRNFHPGDAVTLWGFIPGISGYQWDDELAGAAGSKGATLRANIVGGAGRMGDGIDASITFAGLSVAEAKTLAISVGAQPAGTYLYFAYPGA